MRGRPRLAVDARSLVGPPAGVGYYTRALLARLARRGRLRITALTHRNARDCEELADAGVELRTLAAPVGFWWQQHRLPRELRRGYDLLWSPLGTLPRSSPIPAVVTVHDITPLLFPYWHSWRNRVTFRRQLPATLRAAARIVAVSAATAGDLERRFPTCAGRLVTIRNGVDPEFEPAPASEIDAIRRRFDAPAGYALFVGTLEPRKNLGRLLDAWELTMERLPDGPPLLVVGAKGWKSRGLRRRLRRMPRVRYLGRLDRHGLVEVLQGALVFVYPSLYEGFGLPAAEAMACGLPVVTSDTSSLPEVVGDAGILVNPRHTRDLSSALVRVIEDSRFRQGLIERGLARVRQLSWDSGAEELESHLMQVLNARHKR